MDNAMNIHDILKYLPHRYPFLLIDKVISYVPTQSIKALKNVTINEQYFQGHFPVKPVMPGVLILEAMAQTAGVLMYKAAQEEQKTNFLFYFAGIDNARFKRVVEPGDQLIFDVQIVKAKRDICKLSGIATVNGQVVCTSDMLCAKKDIEE